MALANSSAPPDDPSLKMVAMFSNNRALQDQLMEVGEERLRKMDALGVDRQLLLLTSPGVQVLSPDLGTNLAALSNDRLVEICRKHPDRFSGLAAIAPQNVKGAVAEIERAKTLGLNGVVVNSHTQGHYLDEAQYLPIWEALEATDQAIYIHPTSPSRLAEGAYLGRAMYGAMAGYSHEVWLHTMAIILAGVFDRYPKLRVVIGHAGEAMPLLLYRFDWWQSSAEALSGRHGEPAVKLKRKISDYFKTNIWITTSGVAWEPAIKFCMDVLGPDRVIYAMDYPYQQSKAEVDIHDALDIPAEHKAMLMQTNAERVFRL